MKIQPVSINQSVLSNQLSFNGFRNMSKEILTSDRKGLIDIAEFFHKAPDEELKQITNSNPIALNKIKEAIELVITRKKCYIADGSTFAAKRAEELDKKAESRFALFLDK